MVIVFEELRFQNIFRVQENAKPAFYNFSGLKNVFEKLQFHDGLLWTFVDGALAVMSSDTRLL